MAPESRSAREIEPDPVGEWRPGADRRCVRAPRNFRRHEKGRATGARPWVSTLRAGQVTNYNDVLKIPADPQVGRRSYFVTRFTTAPAWATSSTSERFSGLHAM